MTSDSHLNLSSTTPLIQEDLTKASAFAARARCTQCGKSMRDMPLFLQNITCRDCYGLERYRGSEAGIVSRKSPIAAPVREETATP